MIYDTGGTFNKRYDPIKGELYVENHAQALKTLLARWRAPEYRYTPIIGKDSLEMDMRDRIDLLSRISSDDAKKIVIIHGTDTIDQTAAYLADAELEKCIVLTGAMVPFSIDTTEAAANFGAAIGFLHAIEKEGVFISMNGIVAAYDKIKKERSAGYFR